VKTKLCAFEARVIANFETWCSYLKETFNVPYTLLFISVLEFFCTVL